MQVDRIGAKWYTFRVSWSFFGWMHNDIGKDGYNKDLRLPI